MINKTIIFDLDETLISHKKSLKNFIDYQYNHYFKALNHIPYLEWKSKFIELEKNGYVVKEIVYEQLTDIFDISLKKEELYNNFISNFHKFTSPLESMNELLHRLISNGVKLGLLTNGGELIQKNKIFHLAFENIFDEILISETEGIEKPNPEIFYRAANSLRINPKECIFVGDHPINDIKGAHDVGMKTIWISHDKSWNDNTYYPDWVVKDLIELNDIIDEVLNPNKVIL